MKKLLTLGLSLLAVIAVLSLSACGQKEETPGTGTATEQPAQPETGGAGGDGTTDSGAGATPAEPAAGGGQ
jgi:predicted small lipoprotein YifL